MLIGLSLLAGILPRIANFSQVWEAMRLMTWAEVLVLVLATGWNISTYLFVMVAALPGLRLRHAFLVSQMSTAISNTLPAGSALGVGVSYALFSTYGHEGAAIAVAAVVTGLWNTFIKLGLPIVALAWLASAENPNPALLSAAVVGLLVLSGSVLLLGLVLWRDRTARTIGISFEKLASAVIKPFGRGPIAGWSDGLSRFRQQSVELLRHRWAWLTGAAIVSHLSLFLVLLLALRSLGVPGDVVSGAEAFGAFAFVRLLTALPVTPGGLGVVELGMVGALVLAGGPEVPVVAAVLTYRILTYGLQVVLGAISYPIWLRTRHSASGLTS